MHRFIYRPIPIINMKGGNRYDDNERPPDRTGNHP